MAAAPTCWYDNMRKISPNPGNLRTSNGSIASDGGITFGDARATRRQNHLTPRLDPSLDMCDHLRRLITHNRIVGHMMATVNQEALGSWPPVSLSNVRVSLMVNTPQRIPWIWALSISAVINMAHDAMLSWYGFLCKMPDSSGFVG
jgi:hypothetical protein